MRIDFRFIADFWTPNDLCVAVKSEDRLLLLLAEEDDLDSSEADNLLEMVSSTLDLRFTKGD